MLITAHLYCSHGKNISKPTLIQAVHWIPEDKKKQCQPHIKLCVHWKWFDEMQCNMFEFLAC